MCACQQVSRRKGIAIGTVERKSSNRDLEISPVKRRTMDM